nr:MAG TPA: hypothetical protein [Caudoviricetes sp.]
MPYCWRVNHLKGYLDYAVLSLPYTSFFVVKEDTQCMFEK